MVVHYQILIYELGDYMIQVMAHVHYYHDVCFQLLKYYFQKMGCFL